VGRDAVYEDLGSLLNEIGQSLETI